MAKKALYSFFKRLAKPQLKNHVEKTLAEYKREALIEEGRNQFKELIEKGLSVPVVLL